MGKKIGQNFLVDSKIANKIVAALSLKKGEKVLEIGPGKGILTKLISKSNRMDVIELDDDLKPFLDKIENIEIFYGSCLDMYWPQADKVVSNLPYDITEPFFIKLSKYHFHKGVFMIGSNFYNIIKEKKGRNGNFIWALFDVKKVVDVPNSCFDPRPDTSSVVIELAPAQKKDMEPARLAMAELFLQHDKKLRNSLRETLVKVKHLTKKEAKTLLTSSFRPCIDFMENYISEISNTEFDTLKTCLEGTI